MYVILLYSTLTFSARPASVAALHLHPVPDQLSRIDRVLTRCHCHPCELDMPVWTLTPEQWFCHSLTTL
jgi:hypothetical protein